VSEMHPDQKPDEVEYFGAPTEYADVQEAPEWVVTATKILFFLPGALVTATTIPLIVLGLLLVCLFACVVLVMAI